MSAHILLNLLNKLRKTDKMQGLQNIISFFRNEFKKFNNTQGRWLDPIYHMMFKLFCFHFFGVKMSRVCQVYATL